MAVQAVNHSDTLVQVLLHLKEDIKQIESGYLPQETQVLEHARDLAARVHRMREEILQGMDIGSTIDETLKKWPIPLSTAQALTTILRTCLKSF